MDETVKVSQTINDRDRLFKTSDPTHGWGGKQLTSATKVGCSLDDRDDVAIY